MQPAGYDRLVRVQDRWIAGVCGGVARRFGLPPAAVRVAWLVAVLFFGTGLLMYVVLWWLMPSEGHVPVEPTVWVSGPDGARHPPLARTTHDRKLLGVCGGLAKRWGVDPTLVRLATLALLPFSGGLVVLLYLGAAIVIPAARPPQPKAATEPFDEGTADARTPPPP